MPYELLLRRGWGVESDGKVGQVRTEPRGGYRMGKPGRQNGDGLTVTLLAVPVFVSG